ncbi:Gfo/Idh/MocA family protein [Deinococcus yavapaiensis]|uniref:Putative dehydrogenase n=1 Tax=Deinococcus yavapaiensis KR-236 TaxID=694435 RepID=A0A318SCC2_9DEIO|nr:Gfo/Idh/MocA family oxidoreductase [Deinococcus yavapaiensis]PYE56658.1 putative dehydrogenase [Deinococcus yavapaiensis KR-236]
MSETPSAHSPLRLVHVGTGGWGRSWMRVLQSSPDVTPVAWVDPYPESLAAAVKEGAHEGACFPSLSDALNAVEADAALVTTSVAGHVPVAVEALSAGLHVLVEKPFAMTLREARSAVDAARTASKVLAVSQNYRHHPAPRFVQRLVNEERVGTIGTVEIDFRRDFARTLPTGAGHHTWPQPLLVDMAIHHFDLLRMVLGREPLRIRCHAFNPPWSPYKDPAAAYLTIEFEGGVMVDYRGSWASSGPVTPWAGEWKMDFSNGEIAWSSRGDDPAKPERVAVRGLKGNARAVRLPAVPHLDRAGTLADFVHAIRTGREPETSGRDNLASLALSLAAVKSAQEDRTVDLSEFLSPSSEVLV